MTLIQVTKTVEEVLNLDPSKMQADDLNELISMLTMFAENTEWLAKKYSADYEPIRIGTLNFFKRLVESSSEKLQNIDNKGDD